MAKYVKKPVTIDAWPISELVALHADGAGASAFDDIFYACGPAGPLHFTGDDHVVIKTIEGDMIGGVGDMLIRGLKGEFYPCKMDIFEASYEAAGGDNG